MRCVASSPRCLPTATAPFRTTASPQGDSGLSSLHKQRLHALRAQHRAAAHARARIYPAPSDLGPNRPQPATRPKSSSALAAMVFSWAEGFGFASFREYWTTGLYNAHGELLPGLAGVCRRQAPRGALECASAPVSQRTGGSACSHSCSPWLLLAPMIASSESSCCPAARHGPPLAVHRESTTTIE